MSSKTIGVAALKGTDPERDTLHSAEDDGREVARGASGVLVVLGGTHHQRPLDQEVQLRSGARWAGMTQRLDLPNQECAKAPTVRVGLCMCRMAGIRKRKVGRKVPTASEARIRDEFVEPIEEPEKPGSRFRGAG